MKKNEKKIFEDSNKFIFFKRKYRKQWFYGIEKIIEEKHTAVKLPN